MENQKQEEMSYCTITVTGQKSSIGMGSKLTIRSTGPSKWRYHEIVGLLQDALFQFMKLEGKGQMPETPEQTAFREKLKEDEHETNDYHDGTE